MQLWIVCFPFLNPLWCTTFKWFRWVHVRTFFWFIEQTLNTWCHTQVHTFWTWRDFVQRPPFTLHGGGFNSWEYEITLRRLPTMHHKLPLKRGAAVLLHNKVVKQNGGNPQKWPFCQQFSEATFAMSWKIVMKSNTDSCLQTIQNGIFTRLNVFIVKHLKLHLKGICVSQYKLGEVVNSIILPNT